MRAMPCRISGHRAAGRQTTFAAPPRKKGSRSFPYKYGAGKESRTLDLNLGKVALYQLSYSRILPTAADVSICMNQQASNYIAIFWLHSIASQKSQPTDHHPSSTIRSMQRSRRILCRIDGTNRIWRRGPESNRTNRICNPGHNRFATAPGIHIPLTKKGSNCFPFCGNWSGKRVSNSRPQPWQGCALPTELFPHFTEASHCTTFASME